MALEELFNRVAETLRIEFDYQARLLGHPGEVGTGRENVLKRVLTKYLPKRYAVDSGFVVDALDGRSDQIDLIIYEVDYTPIFEIVEGKSFFPCETVVAVGQVKTDIGSVEKFRECLDNIKSAKALDRSNRGTNQPITGPGISFPIKPPFNPNENFRDQIFGFIFCSASIQPALMIEELQKFNKQNHRKLWTNLIVNYKEFLIEYENATALMQDTMKAENFVVIDKSCTDKPMLTLFVSILNDFLNMAHVARPNLFDYLRLGKLSHYGFPLFGSQ